LPECSKMVDDTVNYEAGETPMTDHKVLKLEWVGSLIRLNES